MFLAVATDERKTSVAATLKIIQVREVIDVLMYHGYKYYSETNVQIHLLVHKMTSSSFNCIPPNARPLQFPKIQFVASDNASADPQKYLFLAPK